MKENDFYFLIIFITFLFVLNSVNMRIIHKKLNKIETNQEQILEIIKN